MEDVGVVKRPSASRSRQFLLFSGGEWRPTEILLSET